MKLRILGSFGGESPTCRMTSFLVDDVLAVDAGAITSALSIPEQRSVRHVLISHSHMDHTASLPFLIENSFADGDSTVSIYCTGAVLSNIRRHLFNNDTWPDFSRIPNHLYPSVRFVEVDVEKPFIIRDLPSGPAEITAIPVNHSVPTVGFLIRQGAARMLFTSDTGPTERIWEVANATDDLGFLITECSFPSRLQRIADVSHHLTPLTLQAELEKVASQIPVYLYHFKPPYVDELVAELGELRFRHQVQRLEQDQTYEI